MATKTLTITEEAYDVLKNKKVPAESFSEVIIRLVGKKSLTSFCGALSEKSADALSKSIKDFRNIHKKSHYRRFQK